MNRILCLIALSFLGSASGVEPSTLKSERFDRDPGWEGNNNRTEIKSPPVVKQDFGYSATSVAGKTKGEIGGSVTRTTKPAYYAAKIRAEDTQRQAVRLRHVRDPGLPSGRGSVLRVLQREPARRERTADRLAGAPLRFRRLRRTARGAAHHRAEPILRHLHHAVSARQVSHDAAQARRHALFVDARLRSGGRERQRPLHLHDAQRQSSAAGDRSEPARRFASRRSAPVSPPRRPSTWTCPPATRSRARRSTDSA